MKTRSIISIGIVLFSTIIIYSCQKESTFKNSENKSEDYFVSKQDASKYSEILSNSLRVQSLKSAGIAKSYSVKKIKNVTTIPDDKNIAALYIINYEGGGFTLLSADKRFSPIFGFSDCNSFPLLSEQRAPDLDAMLCAVKAKISKVRQENSSADKLVAQEWKNLEKNSDGSPTLYSIQPPPNPEPCVDFTEQNGPLLTTQFAQGYVSFSEVPYNKYAPTRASYSCDGYGNMKAGCYAVALAQIMKYFQKPTSYNWSLITGPSEESAHLIGDILNQLPPTSWECATGALGRDVGSIAPYLHNSLGYLSAVYDGYNYDYVLSELRMNYPVYLRGNDGTNHGTWVDPKWNDHAWVADGFIHNIICMYDNYGVFIGTASYLYFHMNWGFGGDGDGYYGFGNFNPVFEPGPENFSYNVKMVYLIRP